MSELVFKVSGHKYYLDGKEIPSVSEVTRFLSREVYGEIDQITLERAAERGTAVHRYTEELDTKGTVEVSGEYEGYVAAYVKFLREHDVTWELVEHMVHNEDKYAGTLDRYGTVDGIPCILDIKTSRSIHRLLYSTAQTMYAMALNKPVDKLYILQLMANGTYKLVELDMNPAVAIACLLLHQEVQKGKKKKRKKEKNQEKERVATSN